MSSVRAAKSLYAAVLFAIASAAQPAAAHYAVILFDEPVAARFAHTGSAEADAWRTRIQSAQSALRREIEARHFTIAGSADSVLNAIFVAATPDRVPELKNLPGVKAVIPMRRLHRDLNRATQLIDAPAAWASLGGIENAGKGIRIGILDTGIDVTHPMLQDASLSAPSGYPICSGADCAFTNSKVIVARSYVRMLAAGSDPQNPAADSRPDDFSPRDRDGHGSAVSAVAAGNTASGTVTINGVAPKAFLGNYKIYGSPGVNDFTTGDVVIAALDDAVKDKMDVISHSSGAPAFTGPLDTGSACGQPAGTPCDPLAMAFENAVKAGVVIVSAAGNDGENGYFYPAFDVDESPGDAPDAIAAGASTNSHIFQQTIGIPGSDLQNITGATGDANTLYPGAITLPLVDVPQACSGLAPLSLYGFIALIERSTCSYATQVTNAQNAGASAAIIYMDVPGAIVPPRDSSDAGLIPFMAISNADGLALKAFVDANPGHLATIDSAGIEQDDSANADRLAGFSSPGPSTGGVLIKPDVTAPGTSIYTAAQSYDPNGGVYSSTGFAAADGTSFSTPMAAGAAALVKQQHPGFTAAQIKSAVVNTAALKISTDDSAAGRPIPVDVRSYGAGLLDVGAAVTSTVAATPATLSFGFLSSLPQSRQIQVANLGTAPASLTLTNFQNTIQSGGAAIAIDPSSLNLAAGATAAVTVALSGALPAPGEYSSFIQIQGGASTVRVPYLYIVPDRIPGNLIRLAADFDGTTGTTESPEMLAVKLVDDFGAPISGATVSYTASDGASVQNATKTDQFGIATAGAVLGLTTGQYTFTASMGRMSVTYHATARPQPAIARVQNAANGDTVLAAAPGAYITLIGSGLSDSTGQATAARLPIDIGQAFVSFDAPGISVPGHVSYVSPTQVNVQVPWELAGQSSAQVKVTISQSPGKVTKVPISQYAPAIFESSPGVAALAGSAKAGQPLTIYANGLGPVSNQPASGDPSPESPLAQTIATPVVMFDNQQAAISFSGLTPDVAGVYQINLTVPGNLAPGDHQVTVSIGGKTSKSSRISTQ